MGVIEIKIWNNNKMKFWYQGGMGIITSSMGTNTAKYSTSIFTEK